MIIGIIIGLIVLTLLVAAHELGHAIVARRNGVVVEEYALGFPPKVIGKKVKKSFLGKNVEYRINWLPLGGYVRMKGEYDASDKKGDYGAASYWAKTKILFAGVAVNWLVAALILTVLAWIGLPKIIDNQFSINGDSRTVILEPGEVSIASVVSKSIAEKNDIKTGDKLIRVNNQKVESAATVSRLIKESSDNSNKITIEIERSGNKITRVAPIGKGEKLGIAMGERKAREMLYSTWSAPIVGVGTTLQFTGMTFTGVGNILGKLVTGIIDRFNSSEIVRNGASQKLNEVSQSVTGPVGILGIIFPQAGQMGLQMILFLAAIISISLAVMNVLPIPALDGGRWLVMTIYKLRGKVLTKESEENIQAIGMITLLALMVVITYLDFTKLK